MTGGDGLRLAKRHGDTSLRHFRERGVAAAAVVGFLAKASGLRASGAPCMARELVADFSLVHLPRTPIRGDDHGLC